MPKPRFSVDGQAFKLDGARLQIICGELHYPRVPREYWRQRLQLAKAMGLNAICTYLFWNLHEPREGAWDFSGNLDVAAFVKMAQEEGLWVLVRPGPYVCAEWEFGGLPWWLLKTPDIRVRCSDPRYLAAVERFMGRVGKELAPCQITRGGPILMVQVENEYGVFGNDMEYLRRLTAAIKKAGFNVPLFRCDWANPAQLVPGGLPGMTVVANFGSNPQRNLAGLEAFRPGSPKMSGEFWMGWFDRWGAPRNGKDRADGVEHVKDIQWMLQQGASLSMYMFHGGTNFGFTAGANDQGTFEPDVTSYDYWAPVDEGGRPREKYFRIREVIAQVTGQALPQPPAEIKRIALPAFTLREEAELMDRLPKGIRTVQPLPMEMFNQAHGCILYRTDLTHRAAGTADLRLRDLHDNAWIYLNGQLVGVLDRRLKAETKDMIKLTIPDKGPAVLDILVEAMGRTNFGPKMHDRKGITDHVELGWLTLMDWETFPLPLDARHLKRLKWKKAGKTPTTKPVFKRGFVTVKETGDTFLDLRGWGKGYVWVNGVNLGRYWRIGPQQTLYLPGVWLKKGKNEIIALDLEPRGCSELKGITEPVLDEVPG